MSDHWWGMDLLEQRDADGLLTPLALALDAILNGECDCSWDEPGPCVECLCDVALRDLWERTQSQAEALGKLASWTHEMGASPCPPGADTYGEGVRDAKAQVVALLGATGSCR